MTFNSWTFLFEVVNFVALAYILQRLLYRPLHDAIDRRREAIERAQDEANRARQEAAEGNLALQAQLASIDEQRKRVLHEARQGAEAERDRILAGAEQEAQHRAALARESLERERAATLRLLQDEVAQHAARLAERLLREVSGEDLDARLARRLADAVRSLPEREREGLAQRWTATDSVTLEAAHDLPPEAVEPVRAAIAELLGHEVQLHVQPAPELIIGLRLRLDGHAWDASLSSDLEGMKDGHAALGTR